MGPPVLSIMNPAYEGAYFTTTVIPSISSGNENM